MIPLPQLALEFLLGLGLALAGANLVVAVQELRRRRAAAGSTRRGPSPTGRRKPTRQAVPSMTRVWVNVAIGAGVAAWAAISLAGGR